MFISVVVSISVKRSCDDMIVRCVIISVIRTECRVLRGEEKYVFSDSPRN